MIGASALSCQTVVATERLYTLAKFSHETIGRVSAIKSPAPSPRILTVGFKPRQLRIELFTGLPKPNVPVSLALP